MKRFLVSWVVILALVLSGCGKTAVSPDASGDVESQQSTAVETDITAAEATEQTADESTEKATEDDTEKTTDSEPVLVNLVTEIYGDSYTATYAYDSSGNTTSAVYRDTLIIDGVTFNNTTKTYQYTYDEAGNLTEQDYIYEIETYDGEDWETEGTETKSEYDAAGKLVSEEISYFDTDDEETTLYGVFVYSYAGNVGTATVTFQVDGETYAETRTVTYDGEGLLLSKEVYYEGEGLDYYPSRVTYDEIGRVVCSITMMNSRYATIATYSYTNDSQGNLLTCSLKREDEYEGETGFLNSYYYEYSYNENEELETISKYGNEEEDESLTLKGIRSYSYHYLDNGLRDFVDVYDEDEEQEYLFYFEYEAAVQLPADEAEAVQEEQTERIRSFLRGEVS
ncbi:MAG: hypothetical protein LUD78_07985 [Clostridiales bacterium]|nr:hypothetical protein [Clostridiales bacterium]